MTHSPSAVTAAWRQYRVGTPGSVLPSEPVPEGGRLPGHLAMESAWGWADDPYPRLLLVTGSDALLRRTVAFAALEKCLSKVAYWTAHDYARNSDHMDSMMRLARATSGSDDVLREAYSYETAFHAMEASEWLFLDMLSESGLSAARSFDLFHLLLTRASSARFQTVVSAASVQAAVSNHDAGKAFQSLFADASMTLEVPV